MTCRDVQARDVFSRLLRFVKEGILISDIVLESTDRIFQSISRALMLDAELKS